jgi:hypothetical protein
MHACPRRRLRWRRRWRSHDTPEATDACDSQTSKQSAYEPLAASIPGRGAASRGLMCGEALTTGVGGSCSRAVVLLVVLVVHDMPPGRRGNGRGLT